MYFFDVDDTLVMWDDRCLQPGDQRIPIVDPNDGATVYVTPHVRHIKLLSQMFGRGRHVIVWSHSGFAWAEAVVRALNLEGMVHTVLTKPAGFVDDLTAGEVLTNRIYLTQGGSK